jgi:hypothetical protein
MLDVLAFVGIHQVNNLIRGLGKRWVRKFSLPFFQYARCLPAFVFAGYRHAQGCALVAAGIISQYQFPALQAQQVNTAVRVG